MFSCLSICPFHEVNNAYYFVANPTVDVPNLNAPEIMLLTLPLDHEARCFLGAKTFTSAHLFRGARKNRFQEGSKPHFLPTSPQHAHPHLLLQRRHRYPHIA